MNVKNIRIKLLTVSDYMRIFNRCKETASRMYHADREALGVPKISVFHLSRLYGYPVEQCEKMAAKAGF